MISLPTGTKIFNWLESTFTSSRLSPYAPLFTHIFILMFSLGGSSGLILGNGGVDLGFHDTYYVVGHFHFVLSLGAIIALFSALYLYA